MTTSTVAMADRVDELIIERRNKITELEKARGVARNNYMKQSQRFVSLGVIVVDGKSLSGREADHGLVTLERKIETLSLDIGAEQSIVDELEDIREASICGVIDADIESWLSDALGGQ